MEALQHSHDVLALAYRPDGKLLASATLDGQIYLWDPQEGHLLVSPNNDFVFCGMISRALGLFVSAVTADGFEITVVV